MASSESPAGPRLGTLSSGLHIIPQMTSTHFGCNHQQADDINPALHHSEHMALRGKGALSRA